MSLLPSIVRRLRPAPLGAAAAYVFGLSKRRVIDTKHGRFLVNPMSVLGTNLTYGDYEPSMTAVLYKYLKQGDIFIDLGANEGYFSVIASKLVGPRGKVFAIEPQSRLQDVMQTNLTINGCMNVQLVKAAIFSRIERVQLHLTSELNSGGSSLYAPTKYPLRKEDVEGITLSEFVSRNSVMRCDLMKVDIEGGEYDVLMSAESMLRSGIIKRIALEIHNSILERRGLSGDKLHNWILGCGYELRDELGSWVYSHVKSAAGQSASPRSEDD